MARHEDKAMEGLLRRSLAHNSAVEPCPDGEILAAYFERSLAADETARYESHFARCARCREQLVTMARMGEPKGAAGARDDVGTGASSRAWALSWNWLAPVAVLATFALVWFIRYRVQTGSTTHTWTAPMVQVIKQEPPSAGKPAAQRLPEVAMQAQPSASEVRTIEPPAPARSAPVKTPPAVLAPEKTLRQKETAEPSNNAVAMVEKKQGQAAAGGEQPANAGPSGGIGYGMGAGVGAKAEASAKPSASPAPSNPPNGQYSELQLQASPPAPSPPPPQAPKAATGGAVARVETLSRARQSVEVTGAAPAANNPQAASAAPAAQKAGTSQTQDANALQNVEIAEDKSAAPQDFVKLKEADKKAATTGGAAAGVSAPNLINAQAAQSSGGYVVFGTPAPSVVWRIAPDGFVERSTDNGATWEGTLIKAEEQFLAGSAPTANTCWVVGRGGSIFMTSDSNKWNKIPAPALVDFVAVSATSASSATVTASDGRKFATVNGGKKWQLVH